MGGMGKLCSSVDASLLISSINVYLLFVSTNDGCGYNLVDPSKRGRDSGADG